ncbi:MAG: D-alanyl-D-alanine carboxypeptidase family protein [Firmicutes bacterium]|nr:D-alanyl-D-alanine carboxypeptidase family protein [Bacillota bacterium]
MKRKKLKKEVLLIIILSLTIIIIGIIILLTRNTGSKEYYSKEAIQVIKENKLSDVYKSDYSKTLDKMLQSNNFNIEYIEEYINIEYLNIDGFINNINTYLKIGYNAQEINNIFKLSEKNQSKLLKLAKKDFSKYIDIKNFNIDNLDRYDDYLKKTEKDIQTVVTYVNINLDKEFYTDSTLVENSNDLTVIVNKYHHVDKEFVPKDLVTLFDTTRGAKMVRPAAEAYKLFIEAAKEDGITLESTTAYRSYSFQNTLYTNYVAQDGVEAADTYSARPGSSEHQLGLAVDLNDPNVIGARLDEKDYQWVLKNSYKYGFIVRYTEAGVPITGYMEEPWHIRYLGVELATKVYESGLTYEEYYDLYMMEY